MNFLGATKAWQAIVLCVLIAGCAVFCYMWIDAASTPSFVTLGAEDTFAQMNFGRIYVDHYGEPTVTDAIQAEREKEQAAFAETLAAAQTRIAAGEKDVVLPTAPVGLSPEWIQAQMAQIGQGEIIATVELNLVEAIVFSMALSLLLLYLFSVFVLRHGHSIEEAAPDHA